MPILHWLNRDETIREAGRVPYRLLEEQPEHSYGDTSTENMLIQGDNLDALKALLPYYAGKVKCIFIDPPYNTRSAFEKFGYDDNMEHTLWLEMMTPRLQLLRELLAEDGSIWVTIDDNEAHYLKVLMDEVFGRKNFIGSSMWEKADSPRMDAVYFSYRHDHVLSYAKNKEIVLFQKLKISKAEIPDHYNKVDEEGRRYYTKPLRAMMGGHEETREARPTMYYGIDAPDGTVVFPQRTDGSDGRWRWKSDRVQKEYEHLEWVQGKKGWIPYYKIYADKIKPRPIETIWFHDEVGTNRTSKAEIKAIFDVEGLFSTPKPERLLERIISIATNPHDIVLDSFLGSGTTAAVAHKMERRYIGIEMGEHAKTHCATRLQKVIDGTDLGGISFTRSRKSQIKLCKSCKENLCEKCQELLASKKSEQIWFNGGGFRFFTLGAPIFNEDGQLTQGIPFHHLAAHIWFLETKTPLPQTPTSPFLGIHNETAYYLLYNGILGDKRPQGGNVLTSKILASLEPYEGKKVVYGEGTRFGASKLASLGITFKQTPYDVRAN